MTDMTELSNMSARAYAAAVARGLNAANLLSAEDARGLDSGAWRGELLELVREAWGKPKLYTSPHGDGWRIKVKGPNPFDDCKWGDTEAEALVAALEAEPQPGPVMP